MRAVCAAASLSQDPEGVFPSILGHEGGAEVESVGEGVTSVEVGDHVIPLYIPECRQCKFCLAEDTEVLTDRGFLSRAEVFAACPELVASLPPAALEAAQPLPFGGAVLTRQSSPLYWMPTPAEKDADEAAGIRYEPLRKQASSSVQLRDAAGRYGRHCAVCGWRSWCEKEGTAASSLSFHIRKRHPAELAADVAHRSGAACFSSASPASLTAGASRQSTAPSVLSPLSPASTASPASSASSAPSDAGRARRASLPTPSAAARTPLQEGGGPAGRVSPQVKRPSVPHAREHAADEDDVKKYDDDEDVPVAARTRRLQQQRPQSASTVRSTVEDANMDDDGFAIPPPMTRPPLARPTSVPVGRAAADVGGTPSVQRTAAVADVRREYMTDVLDEVEAVDAAHLSPAASAAPLRFASLNPSTGHLEYLPATALIAKFVTSLVEFTHAAEAPHWAADADEYGLTPDQVARMKARSDRARAGERLKEEEEFHATVTSNGVSLLVDRQHDMFVRVGSVKCQEGVEAVWAGDDFAKVKAGSLLSDDVRQRVKLTGQAKAGLAPAADADELPFAGKMKLRTEEEVTAFLQLYGYWCGDGYLEAHSRVVAFVPKKEGDKPWVLQRLAALGLTVENGRLTALPQDNGQLVIRVWSLCWSDFFFGQYGCKHGVAGQTSTPVTQTGLTMPNVKSVKWFWVWVWRLRKERARCVLAGLRFADGSEAQDVNCIHTSGVSFRDEIVRLALHAGYAARFNLNYKAGDHRGYSKTGEPFIASEDSWAVSYSDHVSGAELVLHNHRDIAEVQAAGRVPVPVWCVTVPPHNLIIARRARRNQQGCVTQASRPVVVGNCKSGKTNLCQAVRATQGRGVMPDGTVRFTCEKDGSVHELFHYMGCSTFAQYTVALEIGVARVNPRANLEEVCLLGCGITTGLGAVQFTAKVQPGSTVAVFGLGGVGLAAVQGAVLQKAERILAIDTNPAKFPIAARFGATECINPKDFPDQRIQDVIVERTDGGVDYSFECIGNVAVMRAALECVHKGWGESVIIGVAGAGEEICTRPFQLVTGRVWRGSAFGGCKGRTQLPGMVEEAMAGKIAIAEFITHRWSLKDINEAFHEMHRPGTTIIRAVIALHK